MRAEMDFQFQLFLMSGGKWTVEPPHYEFCINNTEDGHGTNPNYTYFNYIEDDSSKEKAINEAASKLNGYFVVFPLVKKIAPGVNFYDCESGGCGTVIIFNPDRPPLWISVTLREFANASLNYLTLKSHDSTNDMMVIRLREEIGELSQEELNAPAFSGDEEHFVLNANGNGNGFQIMRFNPDYWDRSLPPSAIQLLTLRYLRKSPEEMEEFERNNGHPDYSQLFINSVDLSDLLILIQKK